MTKPAAVKTPPDEKPDAEAEVDPALVQLQQAWQNIVLAVNTGTTNLVQLALRKDELERSMRLVSTMLKAATSAPTPGPANRQQRRQAGRATAPAAKRAGGAAKRR